LWFHFNLPCGRETQLKLHKIFRHKIKEWEGQGLVKGAVLTYHFENKPTDSLYVCLDISTIKETHEHVQLPNATIKQIPFEIMSCIEQVCSENQIDLEIRDYELAIREAKKEKESQGEPYYRGASVEEIIRFASVGTKIAFQILNSLESGEHRWGTDHELARFILSRLREELGDNYFWLPEGWHFVCNPLLLQDLYMINLAHINHVNFDTKALDFLYKMMREHIQ
jgi:hypothetical protein